MGVPSPGGPGGMTGQNGDIDLSDVVTELREQFEKSKKVSNMNATDTAILAVYCNITGTQPEDLKPYLEELKKVSNFRSTDTVILACGAHYRVNHQEE